MDLRACAIRKDCGIFKRKGAKQVCCAAHEAGGEVSICKGSGQVEGGGAVAKGSSRAGGASRGACDLWQLGCKGEGLVAEPACPETITKRERLSEGGIAEFCAGNLGGRRGRLEGEPIYPVDPLIDQQSSANGEERYQMIQRLSRKEDSLVFFAISFLALIQNPAPHQIRLMTVSRRKRMSSRFG